MIPDGFHPVNGKLPWGQLPALIPDASHPLLYYKPFRGWQNNLWHDGPTIIWAQGIVQAYALPGSDLSIFPDERSTHEGLEKWIAEHESSAWKKSLALALRQQLMLRDPAYLIDGHPQTAAHALVMLGLRIAFPATVFYCLSFSEALKPQWKRLAQNLNFSTWAASAQILNIPRLELDALSDCWPEVAARVFWMHFKVPVLPGKLAQHFTHS